VADRQWLALALRPSLTHNAPRPHLPAEGREQPSAGYEGLK